MSHNVTDWFTPRMHLHTNASLITIYLFAYSPTLFILQEEEEIYGKMKTEINWSHWNVLHEILNLIIRIMTFQGTNFALNVLCYCMHSIWSIYLLLHQIDILILNFTEHVGTVTDNNWCLVDCFYYINCNILKWENKIWLSASVPMLLLFFWLIVSIE